MLKSDPKLQTILSAPTLSDGDKSQIVAELEKHTGGADKSGTVKNLLSALAENNRLALLEGVAEKFSTLISAQKGELELIVTSAAVRLSSSCCCFFPLLVSSLVFLIWFPLRTDSSVPPQKLEPKLLQRIEQAITKSEYSQGKKLKTVTRVNPDILGGLVVEVGERTIDLSVSQKIARLNKLLTDAV